MTKDNSFLQPLKLPVFAGSVAAALFLCEDPATAQPVPQDTPTTVSGVLVKGQPPQGYKVDEPAMVKLTQPVIDTPQMLSITSRQVMEDRGATSLTDVFRNSSGISMAAGESSWQGTNVTLRGFNARNDMYLDGMRDFGSYTRDPFDLEEVEVLQGPSSILFGRGSTGGAINQVSKMPTVQPFFRGEVSGGTDSLVRGTADVDGPLPAFGDGAAFRLNFMAHRQDVAGRDEVRYRRHGLAPSVAFGLGADNRLILSWFHQSENDIPDYGLPFYKGAPAPVPRNNFYGFESDFLHTQVDVETARFEHDFSSEITLRDQLRYATFARQWRDMEPQIAAGQSGPLADIQVTRALQGGHSLETFLQNQMDLQANFRTGPIEHNLVAGWEIGPETSKPTYDNGVGVPSTSLLDPDEMQPFAGTEYARVRVSTTAFTVGAYVIDTLKFGPHWEVSGGVRWDRFDSHYVAQFFSPNTATLGQATACPSICDVHEIDEKPSWRGSVVYKPVPNGTVYFDYSTSFNPSAESLSQIVAVRSFNVGNIGLAPEDNRTFEFGTKWNLLANHLQLQAAIFREEKTNARVPDPTNSQFNILAGDQRVDGGEIEATGQLTDAWQITASYTYLDGKTVKTVTGGPPLNSPLFNVPQNSVAIWTTYQLPHRVQIGGGLNSMSRRYASLTTTPFTSVPGYTTLDAMVKWQATDHIRLQVNINNLTDKYYYDQLHGFHVIPGEGRAAMFTLAYSE